MGLHGEEVLLNSSNVLQMAPHEASCGAAGLGVLSVACSVGLQDPEGLLKYLGAKLTYGKVRMVWDSMQTFAGALALHDRACPQPCTCVSL
jgi:hypothetical protein